MLEFLYKNFLFRLIPGRNFFFFYLFSIIFPTFAEFLRLPLPHSARQYKWPRFRSLKLWFIIRYFGVEGLAARIKNHIELAKEFAGWIKDEKDFELMAPVPFSTVCFRFNPETKNEEELNLMNEKLLEKINASGKIFLSHTKLDGKFVIRLTIGSIRHERRHVENAWKLIRNMSKELASLS